MKYCNVMLPDGIHLAAEKDGKLFDLSPLTMEELISGAEPGAYGDENHPYCFQNSAMHLFLPELMWSCRPGRTAMIMKRNLS